MDTPPSEKELARYLQAHKDDPEEWEETPETAGRPARSDSVVLSVRLKAEEVDRLKALSEFLGVRVSKLVREAVHLYAGTPVTPRIQYWAPREATFAFFQAEPERHVTCGDPGVVHWLAQTARHDLWFKKPFLRRAGESMPCAAWHDPL